MLILVIKVDTDEVYIRVKTVDTEQIYNRSVSIYLEGSTF